MIPFGVFVWCIGWSLLWIGEASAKLKPQLAQQTGKLNFAALLSHPKLKIRNPNYIAETTEKIV